MSENRNRILRIVVITTILVILLIQINQKMTATITFENPDWLNEYQEEVAREGINQEYLVETDYYDFSSSTIQTIISQLLSISNSPLEYASNAAEFVYITIEYDIAASDFQCISGEASKNLLAGKGDCTEQGMALVALLRGAGIPARSVGGCLFKDRTARCDLFAVIPFKQPRYEELTPEMIEQGILSRKQGSRRGGLHLFIEVFLLNEQSTGLMLAEAQSSDNFKWTLIEPTTGEMVQEDSCYLYDTELIIPNNRKDLFCSSDNLTYAIECSLR